MPQWTLKYNGFDPEEEGLREALSALGNGYFCTRGAAEWADADDTVHYPGTYVAGGFNRLVTMIAGRPVENEDLVNLPNWLPLTFRMGGADDTANPWFDARHWQIDDYVQELDLRGGFLTRRLTVTDDQGRQSDVTYKRFVNMEKPHLAAIRMGITARNWSGEISVRSALDGTVTNSGVPRYRDLNSQHLEAMDAGAGHSNNGGVSAVAHEIWLRVRTTQSRFEVAQAARTTLRLDGAEIEPHIAPETRDGYAAQTFTIAMEQGQTLDVEKIAAFYTSRDRGISEVSLEALLAVKRAPGFDTMARGHRLAWKQLWERCDISLDDDDEIQMILRAHIFHLLQTVSRNTIDLDAGVPARGLHGEAYRGHIFWDELYIFPFLNFRVPEITYSLLLYRYRRLDEARALASENGYKGAMFPWQSGSNGREETQSVHLNPESGRWLPDLSRNQRHVNIAIAYNVWQYIQATGNRGFMSVYGAEMLLEIARFWASMTIYNQARDRYEIHGVMGPDEYHEKYPDSEKAGLNNNAYTNVMVSWLLDRALMALDDLLDYRREELREKLSLSDDEVSIWADITHKMYVPFHDAPDGSGAVISQFEGYNDLLEFDWDGYRKKYGNIRRLDRILESEGDSTNRYKLAKQADTLMLFYLFSEESLRDTFAKLGYPFDDQTVRRNIKYYAARTSHGSTLSNIVHAAVTARIDPDGSWAMFRQALESDVKDIQGGTTREGVHLGAMAGTVDLVQRCYSGMEIRDDILFFDPQLPSELDGASFNIRFRGMWLDVALRANTITISARPGGPDMIKIGLRDKIHFMRTGYSRTLEF